MLFITENKILKGRKNLFLITFLNFLLSIHNINNMLKKRLYDLQEGKEQAFPPERVELLKLLSRKEDVYDRLARNIAPSIYENDDIKKGILLQLFGGTKKTHNASGRSHFRSEINILLCGDPGTSKSQLLQFVFNLVPRSQYSSGKGIKYNMRKLNALF